MTQRNKQDPETSADLNGAPVSETDVEGLAVNPDVIVIDVKPDTGARHEPVASNRTNNSGQSGVANINPELGDAIPAKPAKDFVFNPPNVRALVKAELGSGDITFGVPFNLWNIKTVEMDPDNYQRAYVVTKEGQLQEIPHGVFIGEYYDQIKNGACVMEWTGVTGHTKFRTIKIYGGKSLPEMKGQFTAGYNVDEEAAF